MTRFTITDNGDDMLAIKPDCHPDADVSLEFDGAHPYPCIRCLECRRYMQIHVDEIRINLRKRFAG